MTTNTGTSAPLQHYPKIVEAPRSTDKTWEPDTRPSAAPDQEYPRIVEAPRHVEKVCDHCGKPL